MESNSRLTDARAPRVKNRAAAAVQITAEQLLREAHDRQDVAFRAPKQRVEDFEELHEYRGRKRKEFEERIRRTRWKMREWQAYASWEASQGEFDRSRSVYERALDVDPKDISLWLSYTEMELKSRNVQHARNLFDRAVTLLPRIDQLWYKYVYLEELLQNVPGARQVFERWMKWEPDDKGWQAYIKMEERYGELDRASAIYERWIAVRPEPRVWVKWGKFEEERQKPDKAREVFQMALEFFGDDEEQVEKAQAVFNAFAKMETRLKEFERARVIYKFALSRLPRSKSTALYAAYTKFEKQHGTRSGVESTVLGKRRIQYEEELSHDGRNYDTWFDYARLEEEAYRTQRDESESTEEANPDKVREVYERAVAQVPPAQEKRLWRRYIFLWLYYALFEEMETKDFDRSRQIYKTAIEVVPHKVFTFSKLWVALAHFEIRRLDLLAARKALGVSIGRCPKPALFKKYIELETKLREFDRARTLYEKYLEYDPTNCGAWISFAELEVLLGDSDRTRAIYELAVDQPALDMPEVLWKSYIDYEFSEGSRERTRGLYERLLEKTEHVKIWHSYALFEAADIGGDEEEEEEADIDRGSAEKAREVFRRGYNSQRKQGLKEERLSLLQAWKAFEVEQGSEEHVAKVQAMMPSHHEVRRPVDNLGNLESNWELVFPDDQQESNPSAFKLLQTALKWKQAQEAMKNASLNDAKPTDEDADADADGSENSEEGEDANDGNAPKITRDAEDMSEDGED